jgi:hypothetical protein
MSRPITPATSLDNLKQEAKRWYKALREGDPEAGARLRRRSAPYSTPLPASTGCRDGPR